MNQKQNLGIINKYRIVPDRSKKNLLKSAKELVTNSTLLLKEKSQKIDKVMNPYESHPAAKYLFSTVPTLNDFKKFVSLLYQGLFYSVCSLKGPSEQYIRRKSIRLPQTKNSTRKFLLLDLDETLIHSVWAEQPAEVVLTHDGETVKFNVRPFCCDFLERMSRYYQIYVFTASTEDYARPIVDHLNLKKKTIQGLLSRNHCLETQNGLRIKDLRIIKNRQLSDLVIVDNLVHSFGLQLDNGIPILQFTDNKLDKQLLGLEKLLIDMKDCLDVREFLSKKLCLKKCLQINEEQFLTVKGGKKIGSRPKI